MNDRVAGQGREARTDNGALSLFRISLAPRKNTMRGKVASLNVSVATAVARNEIARRRSAAILYAVINGKAIRRVKPLLLVIWITKRVEPQPFIVTGSATV
jgi:hypothetical protein